MTIRYAYQTIPNGIIVKYLDIDLKNTLFSGQAFRWNEDGDGFFGVCFERGIKMRKLNHDLIIENIDEPFFLSHFANYLDLSLDYDAITKDFGFDALLGESLAFAPGIRVLNQQPFETLIAFIISANNNFARIRMIIEHIAERFGKEKSRNGRDYHTFPSPEVLARADEHDLRACGAGYRAPYILNTARQVADGFDLEALKQMPYLEARELLTGLPGVGIKVADCVLLYALGFKSAFPMDVWTKRVIHNLYGLNSTKDADIRAFIAEKFGRYAGIAQQYLFYYAKSHKLGK